MFDQVVKVCNQGAECEIYKMLVSGGIDFIFGLLSAAIIGFVGFLLRGKITGYFEKIKSMDRLGITQLKGNSFFGVREFRDMLMKADNVQVYYRTGIRFWKKFGEDKESSVLAKAFKKNNNLKMQVIIADPNSEVLRKISEAEHVVGIRGNDGIVKEPQSICEEIPTVEAILKQYPQIEYKYDADFYSLPYIIFTYKDKKGEYRLRAYVGLTVPPLLSMNSLQVVSDCPLASDIEYERQEKDFNSKAKLAEQLELHFQSAWQFAKQIETKN